MALTLDDVFALFERFGGERYGEDVTQLEHALQVAALARADGGSDAFVAAALLHDVGQLVDDAGRAAEHEQRDARHEEIGAALLSPLFGPAVTEPMRLHVDAKRYLCAVEPAYFSGLSDASALSLRYQGGPMTAAECARFEAGPFWQEAVQLRVYDDTGKAPEQEVPPLSSYRSLLERLIVTAA